MAARRYDGSRTRNKSIGCPCSSHAAVSEAHESASARMAPRPASWSAAGKAHAFPSVIDPNPHASRPEPVRTRQSTFEDRDAIDGSSAELIRRTILELLEPMLHIDDADVVRPWRGDVRTFPERDRDRGSQEGASREGVGGRPAHRANYARATGQVLISYRRFTIIAAITSAPSVGGRSGGAGADRTRSSADTQRPANRSC